MIDAANYKRITVEEMNDDGVINLLEAFVEMVAMEYMNAMDDYKHHLDDRLSKRAYDGVRNYILSDDFNTLTNLDGQGVIDGLNKMYMDGYRMVV